MEYPELFRAGGRVVQSVDRFFFKHGDDILLTAGIVEIVAVEGGKAALQEIPVFGDAIVGGIDIAESDNKVFATVVAVAGILPFVGILKRVDRAKDKIEKLKIFMRKTPDSVPTRMPDSIPIPRGERIPFQPILGDVGMKPRPGFKFNGEGGISPIEGQVTLRVDDIEFPAEKFNLADPEAAMRRSIHKSAKAHGLKRQQGNYYKVKKDGEMVWERKNSQLHETPLWGNGDQVDVQGLKFSEHGKEKVKKIRHHRGAKGEGGTKQVFVKKARQQGIWVPRGRK